MHFKEGKIVDCFSIKGKDGMPHDIVFRYPSMHDAKAAVRMVNSIRREADYLGMRRIETLKSEKKWLKGKIEEMRKREGLMLFVEAGGKLVGDASIQPSRLDASAHVGTFGIMLEEEFMGIGIGTRLTKKILALAKKHTMFKIIESGYFVKNRRSNSLHQKFGFRLIGIAPKECRLKNGKYCDHAYVYKIIKKL